MRIKTIQVLGLMLSTLFSSFAFSAAPVTHVVFAEKWMKVNCRYTEEQKKACLVGTLFPDIRYIAKIERDKTHDAHVTLSQLRTEKSAFLCGKKLHSYIDEERAQFIQQKGVYDILMQRFKVPKEHIASFLKFLEDELFYAQLNSEKTCAALLSLDKEEKNSQIELPTLKKWHALLGLYFSQKPSETFADLAILKRGYFGVSAEECARWSTLLPTLAKEKFFQDYAKELMQHFDELFAASPMISSR